MISNICIVFFNLKHMYFLTQVLVPSPATNKDMVVAILSEGNYFGEISLLRLDGVQNR